MGAKNLPSPPSPGQSVHTGGAAVENKNYTTAYSFEMGGVALIDEDNLIPVHQSIFSLSLSSVSTCELDIC